MLKKILYAVLVVVAFAGLFFWYATDADKLEYVSDTDAEMYEPMTAGDCTAYEQFDAEVGECYYECDTDEACAEIEEKIESALAELYPDGEFVSDDFTEGKPEPATFIERIFGTGGNDADVVYTVGVGEVLTLVRGTPTAVDQKIIQMFTALSPDALSSKWIEEFALYAKADSDESAYVEDGDGDGKWEMYINSALLESEGEAEVIHTIIHELAHIITLNTDQLVAGISEGACTRFFVEEGCAKEGAFIDGFYALFWKQTGAGYDEKAEYAEANFVSEYAASSPAEDIAETFAVFVLSGEKSTTPGVIADKKVKSLYAYPELVSLRKQLRAGVAQLK